MTKVKLILVGIHDNHYQDDGSYLIEPLTSSVSLIQTEKHNILVDTGAPNFQAEILHNLAKERLKTGDINYLILTHNHLDHCFNAHLFPNALIYTQNAFWHWQESRCHIFPKGIAKDAVPGVSLIQTPGHTKDSLSILLEDEDGKKWAIVGDAINLHYLENGSLNKRVGVEGVKSIQKILDFKPDFIILGHGKILANEEIIRFKELFARLLS